MSLIQAATPVEPEQEESKRRGLKRRERETSQPRVDPVRTQHVHRRAGATQVPIRAILESLGLPAEVPQPDPPQPPPVEAGRLAAAVS